MRELPLNSTLPDIAAPSSEISPLRARLVLCGILVLATALRFHHIASQSLWLDEIWAVEQSMGHGSAHQTLPVGEIFTLPNLTHLDAAGPVSAIWVGTERITGPPLHPLLQRFWIMAFGSGDLAIRSFSAVPSILAIALLYVAAQPLGRAAALWACALMTVAGPQVHYADEARPYALMLFLGLLAIIFVQQIEKRGLTVARCIGLTLALLAMLLIHYFCIGAAAAIAAYALWKTRGRVRWGLLACVAATGILFAAIWGPSMLRQIPRFAVNDPAAEFLAERSPGHVINTFRRLVMLPVSMLLERVSARAALLGGAFVYAAAAVLLVRREKVIIWILWFAGIVGVLAVLDLTRSSKHLEFIRYALLAGPAVCVVIGSSLIKRLPVIARGAIPIAALAACIVCLRRIDAEGKTEYRAVAQAIEARCNPGELVIFAGSPNTYSAQTLCLCTSHYAWPMPGPVMLLESPASAPALAAIGDRQRVWIVCGHGLRDPEKLLPGFHVASKSDWRKLGTLIELTR